MPTLTPMGGPADEDMGRMQAKFTVLAKRGTMPAEIEHAQADLEHAKEDVERAQDHISKVAGTDSGA